MRIMKYLIPKILQRNEKDIIRIEKCFDNLVIYVISIRKMKINENNEIFDTKNALEK